MWRISVALKFIETRDLAEYILIRENKLKTKLDSVKYLLKKKCLPLKRCIQLNLRSSLPEVFYKKGVLKNFAKFTGKQLCQSLFFNKLQGSPTTLLKKKLWDRCFPVNFVKFLGTPIL